MGRQAIGCASPRGVIRMALLRRSARRTSCAQGDSDQVPQRLKALLGKGRLGDAVTKLCCPCGTRIKSAASPGADEAVTKLCCPCRTRIKSATSPGPDEAVTKLCRPCGTRINPATSPGADEAVTKLCRPCGTRIKSATSPGADAPG